jgi:hypothetical protein
MMPMDFAIWAASRDIPVSTLLEEVPGASEIGLICQSFVVQQSPAYTQVCNTWRACPHIRPCIKNVTYRGRDSVSRLLARSPARFR